MDILTPEEQFKVIEGWNKGMVSVKEMTDYACGPASGKELLVKQHLAAQTTLGLNQKRTKRNKRGPDPSLKVEPISLTDSQKEFITQNIKQMTPLEMAKTLFNNELITPLMAEFRVVHACCEGALTSAGMPPLEPILEEYKPPKTEVQVIDRINKYVKQAVDKSKITSWNRECAGKLMKFLHTYRLIAELSNFHDEKEREMYESSFIRFTHDKPDLTEEEIDSYMNLCADIVNKQRMDSELSMLDQARKNAYAISNTMPMAIIEAIGKLRSDIDDNLKRQKETRNILNGKRTDRLKELHTNNVNVMSLIEAFSNAEKRSIFLERMAKRKTIVKEETKRLEDMDSLYGEMFGISQKEIYE